jgi:predicted CopG family antitoxin
MRTTISIDDPVMRDLRQIQKREKKTLGNLISELLAEAISMRAKPGRLTEKPIEWISQPMGFTIDLEDKEALWNMLDREQYPEFFKK